MNPRVLIVDDYDAGRYASGRVLRLAGFDIVEASTGIEALERVVSDRPDLVLLDVRLPDINGVEVCRRIKSSPNLSSTLVLQMSASAIDDGSRVSSLEAGADGYVTSPLEPAVLVATVRSLLRIRTAEKALNEASLQWQATFDAISDGVALLDECGRIKRSNIAMVALLGEREIDTLEMDAAFPADRGEPAIASLLESRQRTSIERRLDERCFRINIDPMTDPAGKLLGGVAIVTDITERKRMDEQLRHAQKLESIGLLAGGVAHDFNNILMGVLGNASLALESLHEPEKTGELLRDVVRAGERAAELTRQLLAYAGKGRFIVGPVDLSQLIHDLVPLIQPSIPRNVRLALDLEPDLPAVQADKTQLEQLVMNLIINAGEAMDEGRGTLSVSTSQRHVDLEELGGYLTDHQQAGDYVVMEVCDTGSGMDEETVKRIFDPFFSTKFLGRGLGLSAALGIVRGHKGGVKVTTAPGCGTTFEVLFPAIPRPVVVEPAAGGTHTWWRGGAPFWRWTTRRSCALSSSTRWCAPATRC